MSAEAERLALQLGRAVRTRVAGVGSGGWEMKMQRQCLGFDCWAESAFLFLFPSVRAQRLRVCITGLDPCGHG